MMTTAIMIKLMAAAMAALGVLLLVGAGCCETVDGLCLELLAAGAAIWAGGYLGGKANEMAREEMRRRNARKEEEA